MSKQQLTLEHLAPYLPYKLKMKFEGEDFEHELVGLDITEHGLKLISVHEDYGTASLDSAKPILRPLSDLTKEIEHNGESFVPLYYNAFKHSYQHLIDFQNNFAHYKSVKYGILQRLFEWHFDVFGLIEKGLALNLNELK